MSLLSLLDVRISILYKFFCFLFPVDFPVSDNPADCKKAIPRMLQKFSF